MEELTWLARLGDLVQFLDHLDPALDLGGLGSYGAEAVDEGLDFCDLLFLILEGSHHLVVALVLEFEVAGVVSLVGGELLLVDLVDFLDDAIHEGAVVGDDEEGAGVVLEVALEPHERAEVEVVGGLVQHEEVWLFYEEAGKVGAHDPASGKDIGGAGEVFLGVAEAGENFLALGLELEAVELLVSILSGAIFCAIGGAILGAFAEDFHDLADLLVNAHGDFEDGGFSGISGFLFKVADHSVFVFHDGATVFFFLSEDDFKDGGFSGAICADESDALAPVDHHVSFLEEDAATHGFTEFFNGKHSVKEGSLGRRMSGAKGKESSLVRFRCWVGITF